MLKMMNHSMYLLTYSIIPYIMSTIMLYNNMFITLEIPLINTFSTNINISLILDWTSCLFLSSVMFISSMVLMFSIHYMPKMYHKKFSLTTIMFISSMTLLILSDNIIFIMLGWDGLGLSSYILVIFYQNHSSTASGSMTLLSNRLGDAMMLLTIAILMMNSNWNFVMNEQFNSISLILILIAASSKSAQFPFSAWLPTAMAAPTPISALVHSSTLVTAGVYMLIRIMNNNHYSLSILLITSSATAIYASMAANWEQDLKKIIALSTLSQIAMMMFAISIKSPLLAFFHLITHALFKSTMFLCAGNMIHLSTYQDMRMMGMTSMKSPLTPSILGITNMALMGIPFTSGFFSKDSIIEMLITSKINSMTSIMMISSIGMTASYSIRMSSFSNKFLIKSKPNIHTHSTLPNSLSILLISPMSIFTGALLLWTLNLEQVLITPFNLKIMIPTIILIGLLIGMFMSFKSNTYIKLGESSINLWFIHFMTSSIMTMFSPTMNHMFMNDKSWQETYGPQSMILLPKYFSTTPDLLSMSLLFLMIMMFMTPLIMPSFM